MNKSHPNARNFSRVLVLGCPGSGKSFLSRRLSLLLNLPLVSLDDEYWRANWERPKRVEWIAQMQELVNRPRWIIDGHYQDTLDLRLDQADAVFFLDFPTHVCFRAVLMRSLMWILGNRSNLPLRIRDNPDYRHGIRIHWPFLKLVLGFRRNNRPKVLNRLQRFSGGKHITVFERRREMIEYLENWNRRQDART